MQAFDVTYAVFLAVGFGLLIYGSVRFQHFVVGFLRRAEDDVRKREAHTYQVEDKMLHLCEMLMTEGQGRTMTALERLASPTSVASARAQNNQAQLGSAVRSIADAVRDPAGNRTSVREFSSLPGVPTFNSGDDLQ